MRVVVCGSMFHYLKMLDIKSDLERLGHKVELPDPDKSHHIKAIRQNNYEDTYVIKKRYDYIRRHYAKITKADSVLIANWDKNNIENYIGGNAFLEMGFAYVLGKRVFLLNPPPEIEFYYHEIRAMDAKVLNGNLKKLC